jgi:ABC-type multidrug transport system permease subunit
MNMNFKLNLPSISRRRVRAVVIREFHEIIRDPLYMALALLVPPFIMVIFGFGLALDVENLPLGIYDRDQTRLSREYRDSFIKSDSFEGEEEVTLYNDEEQMAEDLRASRLRTALIIPKNFEQNIQRGKTVDVAMWVDGSIPLRAEIARGFAAGINAQFLLRLGELVPQYTKLLQRGAGINVIPRILFNPELRSANFVVPGLIATILMFYPALLTTLSIVREKESQSILALYCSPITRVELLLGKILPYLMISVINFVCSLLLALYLFNVPFGGSWSLLAFSSILYVFCTCALGLTISVIVNTQVAAILVTMALTVLPSFLYSGFFTPLSASSWSMWIMGRFVPATYYLDILRGLFLKNTGWDIHWPALLALAVYAAILYIISYTIFRKRLN